MQLPSFHGRFLCQAGLVAVFVTLAHQFPWEWLRWITSQTILLLSSALGLAVERLSFDTIRIQGEYFQFVIACTFVDVFAGSIPFLWSFNRSLFRNLFLLLGAALALFCVNIVRLEIGQILYARGAPWVVVHEILGGFAYCAVWIALGKVRKVCSPAVKAKQHCLSIALHETMHAHV